MGKARHNNRYGRSPRKGTKLRQIIILALRKEGVTSHELGLLLDCSNTVIGSYIDQIRDMKGWDIRAFPAPPERRHSRHGRCYLYRIVGKFFWDGSYRSLYEA